MYWILLSLRQTFGKARLPTHTNLPLLGADCRVARWGCAVQFCGGTSRVFGQGHPPLPLRVPIYHLPTHTCHPISLSLSPPLFCSFPSTSAPHHDSAAGCCPSHQKNLLAKFPHLQRGIRPVRQLRSSIRVPDAAVRAANLLGLMPR
jgi:hypothetical protein